MLDYKKLDNLSAFMEEGVWYVQAEQLFKSAGFTVMLSQEPKKFIAQKNSLELQAFIDDHKLLLNQIPQDRLFAVRNEHIYVPLTALPALGLRVKVEPEAIRVRTLEDPFLAYPWGTEIGMITEENKDLKVVTNMGYVVAYDDFQVCGYSAQAYFHFDSSGLGEIMYRIKDHEGTFDYYEQLRRLLSVIYGKPESDNPVFTDEKIYNSVIKELEGKSEQESKDIFYRTMMNGDVSFLAAWQKENFSITMSTSKSGASGKNESYNDITLRRKGFSFKGSSGDSK